ncbi:pyridoxal kinase isoform X1 [Diachasma alloeum]|uniref:pyridoxal kinase isoform X1 n=1 Tax=Diachasma alloeum TaxID=454923 RepID=UPI0007381F02|nr:pyridoxal kinase isoform X1 [Diachasma alloeum]XP_028982511.1 pyridoxal kinase isoform X1 [Diachasma alloeum]
MTSDDERHVLSIQSHVVYGYCGNKCATFPLQLLGFEVDVINSVQFSNHTGYKVVKGEILNDNHLGEHLYNIFFSFNSFQLIKVSFLFECICVYTGQLMEGLAGNDLDHYSHLLTGYVASSSFLKKISQLVPILKEKNPNLIYVCDPVLGDNGKTYVPEELIEIYKTEVIPLVDIVTPNQFELELLTNENIETTEDVKRAIEKLHGLGPKIVAITSIELNNKLQSFISNKQDDMIITMDIPKIPTNYTGSGDLFAALFLAHSHIQQDLKTALEKTINSLHSVLLRTHEFRSKFANASSVQKAKTKELRLIQSKADIENPPSKLKAQYLNVK